MWECLVGFSTWVEGNSGQLQILIALGAIGLAFAGYKKVLKQIDISTKQEALTERNRFYELKLNLIKAVNEELQNVQVLSDDFLNSVDIFFLCIQEINVKNPILIKDIDNFSNNVLQKNGLDHINYLNNRAIFLDDTFDQINKPDLKAEHIEKILSRIFESDLRVDQIKIELNRMKHLTNAMKSFGKQ